MMNDSTKPALTSQVTLGQTINGDYYLHFTTNEYASVTLHTGTEPGTYTTDSHGDYQTDHHLLLGDRALDTTYYYTLEVTDRSDNTTTTAESTFALSSTRNVYLPAVVNR